MFCASATGTSDQSDHEAEFIEFIEYEADDDYDDDYDDEENNENGLENVNDMEKHRFFLAETHDDLTLICQQDGDGDIDNENNSSMHSCDIVIASNITAMGNTSKVDGLCTPPPLHDCIPDVECDTEDDGNDDNVNDNDDIATDNEVLETMLNSGECAMSDYELNQLTNSSSGRTILNSMTTNEVADEELIDSVSAGSSGSGSVDVIIDANNSAAYVEPDPDLLEYRTATAAETVNLLLPELPSTAALDCGNFVDFDEFNLCLNNILSEDDDEVMAGISKSSSIMTTSNNSWQKMLTTSSNSAAHHLSYHDEEDILNIAQINNDLDLAFGSQPSTSTSTNAAHRTMAIVSSGETAAKSNTTTSASYQQQPSVNSGIQKA